MLNKKQQFSVGLIIVLSVILTGIFMLDIHNNVKADSYNNMVLQLSDNFMDEQGLIYNLNDYHKSAGVTGYNRCDNFIDGLTGYIFVPAYVIYNDDKYYVNSVDISIFSGEDYLTRLYIGDQCAGFYNTNAPGIYFNSISIGARFSMGNESFYTWKELKKITVSTSNYYLYAEDNVLYERNYNYELKQYNIISVVSYPVKNEDTELVLPDKVTVIKNNALRNTQITKISGRNITEIGESAFENSSVTEMKLNKVSHIGKRAFYNCAGLRCLTGADNVVIDDEAFFYCSSLKCVYLPGNAAINGTAFGYLDNLNTIVIDNGSKIGKRLNAPDHGEFYECPQIKYVYFPETMEYVDGFGNVGNMEKCQTASVYFPESITYIDNVFCISESENKSYNKSITYMQYCDCDKEDSNNYTDNAKAYAEHASAIFNDLKDYDTDTKNYIKIIYKDDYMFISGRSNYKKFDEIPYATDIIYKPNVVCCDLASAYKMLDGLLEPMQYSDNKYSGFYRLTGGQGIFVSSEIPITDYQYFKIYVGYDCDDPVLIFFSNGKTMYYDGYYYLGNGGKPIKYNDNYEVVDKRRINIVCKEPHPIFDKLDIYYVYIEKLESYENSKFTPFVPNTPPVEDKLAVPIKNIYKSLNELYSNEDIKNYNTYKNVKLKNNSDIMLRLNSSTNLNEYNYLSIDAAGYHTYNINLVGGYNEYCGEESNQLSYKNVELPCTIKLHDQSAEGGELSDISAIVISPASDNYYSDVNISSVSFSKAADKINDYTAPMPEYATPHPTLKPVPTATPILRPTSKPVPTATPILRPTSKPAPTATRIPEATPVPTAVPTSGALPSSTPVTVPAPTYTPAPVKPIQGTPLPSEKPAIAAANDNNNSTINNTYVSIDNNNGNTASSNNNSSHAPSYRLKAPEFALSRGVTGLGTNYINVSLRKYSGRYVEIYAKTVTKAAGKKTNFKKVKLKNNNIKANKSSFKLKYSGKKSIVYIKIRTYKQIKKHKVYSRYSVVKKVMFS